MTRGDDEKDDGSDKREPTEAWQGNEIVGICRDAVDPSGVWYGGIWRITRDGTETRTGCFSKDRNGENGDD
jgi:hypothetical protein